jgi:hypothetical protein
MAHDALLLVIRALDALSLRSLDSTSRSFSAHPLVRAEWRARCERDWPSTRLLAARCSLDYRTLCARRALPMPVLVRTGAHAHATPTPAGTSSHASGVGSAGLDQPDTEGGMRLGERREAGYPLTPSRADMHLPSIGEPSLVALIDVWASEGEQEEHVASAVLRGGYGVARAHGAGLRLELQAEGPPSMAEAMMAAWFAAGPEQVLLEEAAIPWLGPPLAAPAPAAVGAGAAPAAVGEAGGAGALPAGAAHAGAAGGGGGGAAAAAAAGAGLGGVGLQPSEQQRLWAAIQRLSRLRLSCQLLQLRAGQPLPDGGLSIAGTPESNEPSTEDGTPRTSQSSDPSLSGAVGSSRTLSIGTLWLGTLVQLDLGGTRLDECGGHPDCLIRIGPGRAPEAELRAPSGGAGAVGGIGAGGGGGAAAGPEPSATQGISEQQEREQQRLGEGGRDKPQERAVIAVSPAVPFLPTGALLPTVCVHLAVPRAQLAAASPSAVRGHVCALELLYATESGEAVSVTRLRESGVVLRLAR